MKHTSEMTWDEFEPIMDHFIKVARASNGGEISETEVEILNNLTSYVENLIASIMMEDGPAEITSVLAIFGLTLFNAGMDHVINKANT